MYIYAPMAERVKAAVAGANGYAGMTLVRLLARHPGVELTQLTSRSFAGKPYSDVFPLLELEGTFDAEPDPAGKDVIFSCLPHNVGASKAAGWLDAGARVIDMSADFRLSDAAAYPRWYKQDHPAPELLSRAVPGLPELSADQLPEADLIAVPGCYATAAILALFPAASDGFIRSDVIVDAKSGISGAGRSPGLGVHFSEVNESVTAYSVGGHRHFAEIHQMLPALNLTGFSVTFVPHLIPMTRGILATCYYTFKETLGALQDCYAGWYSGAPFTKIVNQTPATKLVSHTNLCLINVSAQGEKAVVTAAIDNLMKGASGQGVECFNLAFGFDRTTALEGPLQWP
jgi:N-acetyl-gamma-glutamyl-phosphate reductase